MTPIVCSSILVHCNMKIIILILCIGSFGCLKAKKSPFDFNSPLGILFAFYNSSTSQSSSSIIITVSPAYSTNGLNWNDYINRDFSKDIFSQADTACNSANTGGYRTCVHAGEIRKFDIATRSTCTGLTATDSLSAMNWVCKVNANGGVTFYSSALKKGKYLSDLIDWTTNAWKSLTITVKDGSTTLGVSSPLKLWTNAIDASGTVNPSAGGTIYLYDLSTLNSSITVSANKVSIIVNPAGIKSIRTSGTCNAIAGIDISNRTFIWLEGNMDFGNSTQNAYGVLLSVAKFSVVKNVKIQNAGTNCASAGNINNAINLNTATNNYLEDIVLTQTLGTSPANGIGLSLASSDDNLFNGISISNMATDGIQVTSSKSNMFLNTTVMRSIAECVLIQTNSHSLSGNSSGVALGSMTDWVRFDHLYKGIGKFNSAAFPSTLHLGVCNSGNCTIWDLSLKNTDSVLRNANITSTGASCPSGSNMITHTYSSTNATFLRNSVEILNDGVGNDNGLCEANEDCLLTPNIGSYQGHGNLVSASTVSGCGDVTSQGIKLYQYETNGY